MTAFLSGLNNAYLRSVTGGDMDYEIVTFNHPLNLTATQLSRYTIL